MTGKVLLLVVLALVGPLSGSSGKASASTLTEFLSPNKFYCSYMTECCEEEKPFNSTALEADLKNRLFGQHLASNLIYWALTDFMTNESPKKALTLSLHGWTGTGKNLASRIIVENVFESGMDSTSVHLFISTYHFPHKSMFDTYKDQLQSWIRGNVTKCGRSIFIFDEMDRMHPEVIEVIKPFIDDYQHLDKVSYRKTIFIFLNSAGENLINSRALELWRSGKKRESLKYNDIEKDLILDIFNNNKSGFWKSRLIDKNLIDYFIPFLPLEFSHVKMCVVAELRQKGLPEDEELAEIVAKSMSFFPKNESIFSTKGCRTIPQKLIIARIDLML